MFQREVMRILRREPQKKVNDKNHPNLRGDGFAAGFSIKVDEMCTSPKRKRPDVVHLAQQ